MSASQTIMVQMDNVTGSATYTGGMRLEISESLSIGTNTLVACTLDVSQMKTLILLASVDMTVKTNSSGSPAATIALKANQAVQWSSTNDQANPFGSTDVTALYITNAAAGTFNLRTIVDPTV